MYSNQIQRSKYFITVKETLGRFYSSINIFYNYTNLDITNAELMKKISELETKIYKYKHILELLKDSAKTSSINTNSVHETIIYKFVSAKVVNNSIFKKCNYIILNKGAKNGIKPDMGVLSSNGVVGIVKNTSLHFSEVISLLNTQLRLNCKIKNTNSFGLLVWDGKDARYTCLTDLPQYVTYKIGDTIVTNGFSAVFPEGIPVGIIVNLQEQQKNVYNIFKVKFFTRFDRLNEVLIVKNFYQKEQNDLQKSNFN